MRELRQEVRWLVSAIPFALGGLTCFLASTSLAAAVRPVQLVVERDAASAACPDEAALRSAVFARLGFDPFVAQAPASVSIAISPKSGGHQATLTLVDERGDRKARVLSGVREDCADLREALGLSLSVAMEAFTAAPAPSDAPVDPVPEPTVPPPAPITPPPVPKTVPVTPFLGGRASLVFGGAPSLTGAFAVGGGIGRSWWSVGLEARAQLPAGVTFESGRVDTAVLAADLVPCFVLSVVRACGVAGGGVTWSWATNLDAARTSLTPSVTLGARLEAALPVTASWSLVAFAEFRAALARTLLRVGSTPVWQTPPVAGALGVGAVFRWSGTDSDAADK